MYISQAKWDAVTLTTRIGGLEMTTKKLRRAETAAERKAMAGSAQEFEFIWTNRDWSERFLEYVRLAALIVKKDDRELGKAVGGLAERGLMADLIQEWILTGDHFKDLAPVVKIPAHVWNKTATVGMDAAGRKLLGDRG